MTRDAHRPLIGVTGPDRGGAAAWWMTRLAIARAGGRAVRITPSRARAAEGLDGLVLGGGADVVALGNRPTADEPATTPPAQDPPLWRRALGLLVAPALLLLRALSGLWTQRDADEDRARDALELTLLAEAERLGLPVLGICRGAQLMSLSRGGSLLWNLRALYAERPNLNTVWPAREVDLSKHSRLSRVLGTERTRVNSLHSHAVDRPGEGLRVVAREPSGVHQAIERTAAPLFIGVQWHPEYLPQLDVQQRLFEALVSDGAEVRHARQHPQPALQDSGAANAAPGRPQRPTPRDAAADAR